MTAAARNECGKAQRLYVNEWQTLRKEACYRAGDFKMSGDKFRYTTKRPARGEGDLAVSQGLLYLFDWYRFRRHLCDAGSVFFYLKIGIR